MPLEQVSQLILPLGPIYDDIVSHIKCYASDEAPKDNNWWDTGHLQDVYYDLETSGHDVRQFAFYLYALGDKMLN